MYARGKKRTKSKINSVDFSIYSLVVEFSAEKQPVDQELETDAVAH